MWRNKPFWGCSAANLIAVEVIGQLQLFYTWERVPFPENSSLQLLPSLPVKRTLGVSLLAVSLFDLRADRRKQRLLSKRRAD